MTSEERIEFVEGEVEHLKKLVEELQTRIQELENHRDTCTTSPHRLPPISERATAPVEPIPKHVKDCGGGPVFVDEPVVVDAATFDETTKTGTKGIISFIRANEVIENGFPDEEGTRLANHVLSTGINWNNLTIDISTVAPPRLISAFFFSFFRQLHRLNPDRLAAAMNIHWQVAFPFQADLIKSMAAPFQKYILVPA